METYQLTRRCVRVRTRRRTSDVTPTWRFSRTSLKLISDPDLGFAACSHLTFHLLALAILSSNYGLIKWVSVLCVVCVARRWTCMCRMYTYTAVYAALFTSGHDAVSVISRRPGDLVGHHLN